MKSNLTWASAAIAAALTFAPGLPAQLAKKMIQSKPAVTQDKLIAERSKKLAKPVFEQADWLFDYDAARAEAERSGKLLFTYFSRSYAY